MSRTPRTSIVQKKNTTQNLLDLLTKCSNRNAPNSTQMTQKKRATQYELCISTTTEEKRNTTPRHNIFRQILNVRVKDFKTKKNTQRTHVDAMFNSHACLATNVGRTFWCQQRCYSSHGALNHRVTSNHPIHLFESETCWCWSVSQFAGSFAVTAATCMSIRS